MKVYYCNINKINETIDDFVIAKNKIEIPLIKQEKIDHKMSISEFLDYIDLSKNIFVFNNDKNDTIAFNIYLVNPIEIVVVYASDCIDKQVNIFKDKLDSIKYNLSKLNEFSQIDILNKKVNFNEYFLIDGKFFN